jgi:hypothetical protein|tara:strand:+ start:560 stop:1345 length:786 start_codon:yes stop_codon:yes gene_type:complete
MAGPHISDDGRWMWDGKKWIPIPDWDEIVSKENIDRKFVEEASARTGVEADRIADAAPLFDINEDGEIDEIEVGRAAEALSNPVSNNAPDGSIGSPIDSISIENPKKMFERHNIEDVEVPEIDSSEALPAADKSDQKNIEYVPAPIPQPQQVQPKPIISDTQKVVKNVVHIAPTQQRVITTNTGAKPSILAAYLLWLFLAPLGVYHLYVGRGVMIWFLALITGQGCGIWWFLDLFLIPSSCNMVRGSQTQVVFNTPVKPPF